MNKLFQMKFIIVLFPLFTLAGEDQIMVEYYKKQEFRVLQSGVQIAVAESGFGQYAISSRSRNQKDGSFEFLSMALRYEDDVLLSYSEKHGLEINSPDRGIKVVFPNFETLKERGVVVVERHLSSGVELIRIFLNDEQNFLILDPSLAETMVQPEDLADPFLR